MLEPALFLATAQPRLRDLELSALLERPLRVLSQLFLQSLGVVVLASVDHLKTEAFRAILRLLKEGLLDSNTFHFK